MAIYDEVYIAEKPSLARAIADGLSNNQTKKDGFILVDDNIAVTHCFGHMLSLFDPKDYDPEAAKWSLDHIPYNPSEWKVKIKLGADQKTDPRVSKQLDVIKSLLNSTKKVINAGDPDREGQMLVDELLEYFNWNGNTARLLANATDLGSIKKALSSMKDNKQFKNLYESAKCRARADWMVGMSLTVAATRLLSKNDTISIGRVQTPTLGLIVARELAIKNFVSRNFFNLKAQAKTSAGLVEMMHTPTEEGVRIYDEEEAKRLAEEIKGQAFEIKVTEKDSSESPPSLFQLQTLQKEVGSELGLNATAVLKIAQELYEKKFTSYPRTDCQYLPTDQKDEAVSLANKILAGGFIPEAEPLASLFAPKAHIYDSKKAPVHHAIIPTNKIPDDSSLVGHQRAVYEIIAKRFILSLLPSYKFKETKFSFVYEKREFLAKGEVPLNMEESWRAISQPANPPVSLPPMSDGSKGLIQRVEVMKGKTTPPNFYTEGDLLTDMSSIAKFVEDEKYKQVLKETSGIGTPATQAAIIETLKKRGYVYLEGKGKKEILRASEFGIQVIAAIPKNLREPALTAIWEETLSKIADGEYDPETFMDQIVNFTSKRIEDMKVSGLTVTARPDLTQYEANQKLMADSQKKEMQKKPQGQSSPSSQHRGI